MDNFNWGVRRRSLDSTDLTELLEESQHSDITPCIGIGIGLHDPQRDSDDSSEEESNSTSQSLSHSQLVRALLYIHSSIHPLFFHIYIYLLYLIYSPNQN